MKYILIIGISIFSGFYFALLMHAFVKQIEQLQFELSEAKRMMDAAVVVGDDFKKSFWEARAMSATLQKQNKLMAEALINISEHGSPYSKNVAFTALSDSKVAGLEK